jgi:hypothetical protein
MFISQNTQLPPSSIQRGLTQTCAGDGAAGFTSYSGTATSRPFRSWQVANSETLLHAQSDLRKAREQHGLPVKVSSTPHGWRYVRHCARPAPIPHIACASHPSGYGGGVGTTARHPPGHWGT